MNCYMVCSDNPSRRIERIEGLSSNRVVQVMVFSTSISTNFSCSFYYHDNL